MNRTRSAVVLASLAVVGVVLGACTSESSDTATSTAPSAATNDPPTTPATTPVTTLSVVDTTLVATSGDACALLLPDEAALLAATQLDPPTQSDGICTYTAPVTGPLAQVEIYVGPGALKILEIDRDVLGHQFAEVTGIGDEAVAEDGAIFVRVADTWLALRYVTLDEPTAIAGRLEDAARTAAGRL